MNDLASYAADIFEGITNLIGVGLFFLFVLPPFLFVFVPLLVISASVLCCGASLYVTYICCGVAWDLAKNLYHWIRTGKPPPSIKAARRRSIYHHHDQVDVREFAGLDKQRRLSGTSTPRRIAQPRSRSGSMHLKKSDSVQSLVGTGSDRDFEDTGGWANSNEDDEAMYMARTIGVQEPMYSPVLYRNSESAQSFQPSLSSRTSIASSKAAIKDDLWKFTSGGGAPGSTTPRAHQSGTSTPESYFTLPSSLSRAASVSERPQTISGPQSTHKKTNSSSSSLVHFSDERSSNRDSGFYG